MLLLCDDLVLNYNYYVRWNGESLRESIKRHEHFLALQLGLKPGMNVSFFLIEMCDSIICCSYYKRNIRAFHLSCRFWMWAVALVDH
jgi:hypothetical protein